jgi:hypothetical protein
MGGYGSGKWDRWGTKATVDRSNRLDVRWLQRNGYLTPGRWASVSWNVGGRPAGDIRVLAFADRVELHYRSRERGGEWQDVAEVVQLDWTPCNYGGRRVWFLCPDCGRRVAVLVAGGRLFLCRTCYGMAYDSQREGPLDRQREKAQAIRHKLGGSRSLLDPFPDKPKGMRWATYARLHSAALDSEAEHWQALSGWIDRSNAKWNRVLDRCNARAAKAGEGTDA